MLDSSDVLRYSHLWHTISQVLFVQMGETFEKANEADDETTKSGLKLKEKDDFLRLEKT
jgi:hypothetical protein